MVSAPRQIKISFARSRQSRTPSGRSQSNVEIRSSVQNDLLDSPADQRKLEGEEATLDLPGVKDIPGQEHVIAPSLGELGDTPIASSDEEGDRVIENISDRSNRDRSGDVSPEEKPAWDCTD